MDPMRLQKAWCSRISKEEKAHKKFRDHAKQVEKIFRADNDLYVPLYWSVVNVEHTGVYSNQPVPDVRCRAAESSPQYKTIARIIQRGLSYCVDHPSFDSVMHRTIDDYLAVGLGWPRVKIDSIINSETYIAPIMAEQVVGFDSSARPIMGEVQVGEREEVEETVGAQTIRWEYVPWGRFGWEPGNSWKNTDWIYVRHPMTPVQAKKRFGKIVKGSKKDNEASYDSWKSKTIDIYEVWDKPHRRVLFIAKGEDEPLEIHEDPLELVDFWPGPEPMMLNLPSEELIPQPDYDYIEEYDRELNRLQERRMALLESIKAGGAYEQGIPELGDMMKSEDGEYIAIKGLAQRLGASGGSDGILFHLPLQEKSAVLQELNNNIQLVRAQVDDILGISDIVRGVTNAYETAQAQEIKGRWVGIRLTRKRECVNYTVKSMMKIMAQLLLSHITPENLSRMTQMQISDELMQVMSQDILMDFLIDIETDSTVAKDEFQEKQTFQEMLNGVAQYSQAVLPMVQQNAFPADAASAVLRAALKPYAKYDRGLDEALTTLPTTQQQMTQLNQQLQELQQKSQQTEQQLQYWQGLAQQMQQQATEAKAAREQAEAQLKKAQAAKTAAQIPTEAAEQAETIANTELTQAKTSKADAETIDILRGRPSNGAQIN